MNNKYLVVDNTTGRQIACIGAKSLHAAKCLSAMLLGYNRFYLVIQL